MLIVDSLVSYKNRPARVLKIDERIEIQLLEGEIVKVRPKDVLLLHPGPIRVLSGLKTLPGEVELAWQILVESGEIIRLEELAELIFGYYNPETAWNTWLLVEDGLYFQGEPDSIQAHSVLEVEKVRLSRAAKAEQANAWENFTNRIQTEAPDLVQDAVFLREVEDLALGRREDSRLLRSLGRSENPSTAHTLLLKWGVWKPAKNPHPARLGVNITAPDLPFIDVPDEPRLDLTDLLTFAIDEWDNSDPDDAVSLIYCDVDTEGRFTGGRLWVHIADPAAVADVQSEIDLEARSRGATAYMPEWVAPMLPVDAIHRLALGLQEISPAVSFEIELDQDAEPHLLRFSPSWVRVQRLSYQDVDLRLEDAPFRELKVIADAFEAHRTQNGALSIDLPEVILRVSDDQIQIRPVEPLRSRDLVREAMLIAGEATGAFALEYGIPIPFTIQDPPEFPDWLPTGNRPPFELQTIAGSFSMRRFLKRSQVALHPGIHSGLGLLHYCRMTSPLRRYADLAAHQQLRAFLRDGPKSENGDLLQRIGEAEEASIRIAQAESLSRRHWTLVYLLHNPGWKGGAILVAKNGLRGQILVPELAYEAFVHLRKDLPLDTPLTIHLREVDIPELEAYFALE